MSQREDYYTEEEIPLPHRTQDEVEKTEELVVVEKEEEKEQGESSVEEQDDKLSAKGSDIKTYTLS